MARIPPRLQTRDEREALREVRDSMISLKQAKELLALVQNGGKAVGFGLIGTVSGMIYALASHASMLYPYNLIGTMIGLAVYSLRFSFTYRMQKYEQLDDELRDLKTLHLIGTLTEEEYERARLRVLKKAGLLDSETRGSKIGG